MAHRDGTLPRANRVAIGGIADMPQMSRAPRCDAIDPELTSAGWKSRSAVASHHGIMCYSFVASTGASQRAGSTTRQGHPLSSRSNSRIQIGFIADSGRPCPGGN